MEVESVENPKIYFSGILRKSNRDASTAIHWENKDKICSSFSSRAFSGVIFEAMNWKWSCRYQCRGICRGEENAKFLIFELDESRILIRKNQYEQIEDRSMNLKCRLYLEYRCCSIEILC